MTNENASTVEISYPELKELFTDILAKLPEEELRDFHGAVGEMLSAESVTLEVLSGRDKIVNDAKMDVEKYFVEDFPEPFRFYYTNLGISGLCTAKFFVNREKRTVVVIIRNEAARIVSRGIAKAHPDDCFNEYIGKAIALHRALGYTVPDEYLNAPQPEGKQAGDIVAYEGKSYRLIEASWRDVHSGNAELGSYVSDSGKVIDDSARYK